MGSRDSRRIRTLSPAAPGGDPGLGVQEPGCCCPVSLANVAVGGREKGALSLGGLGSSLFGSTISFFFLNKFQEKNKKFYNKIC